MNSKFHRIQLFFSLAYCETLVSSNIAKRREKKTTRGVTAEQAFEIWCRYLVCCTRVTNVSRLWSRNSIDAFFERSYSPFRGRLLQSNTCTHFAQVSDIYNFAYFWIAQLFEPRRSSFSVQTPVLALLPTLRRYSRRFSSFASMDKWNFFSLYIFQLHFFLLQRSDLWWTSSTAKDIQPWSRI